MTVDAGGSHVIRDADQRFVSLTTTSFFVWPEFPTKTVKSYCGEPSCEENLPALQYLHSSMEVMDVLSENLPAVQDVQVMSSMAVPGVVERNSPEWQLQWSLSLPKKAHRYGLATVDGVAIAQISSRCRVHTPSVLIGVNPT
jgi:hypothetical protein